MNMRRLAPALAASGLLCLGAQPASAGSASVNQVDGRPTVVFTGGNEANDLIAESASQPGQPAIKFTDTGTITLGTGCRRPSGGGSNQALCEFPQGPAGTHRASLGAGSDTADSGVLEIRLEGEEGADTLKGARLDGGPGSDDLEGTTGGDRFFVASGDGIDTIDGGPGVDADALTLAQPGTLDMRGNTDAITSVEGLAGTNGNDVIIADDRSINGRGWEQGGSNGNDRLVAGATGAILLGGNGDDTIEGGPGDDELGGGNDDDVVSGGPGPDTLSGGNGEDIVRSNDGVAEAVNCGDDVDRAVPDLLDGVNANCELLGEDTDGDALPDDWETNGYDADNDGTPEVDLPAMGADPDHKDIFLELDFMAPHRIEQAAVDRVVQAFAAAPVSNPDGVSGIELHVDNGPSSVMDPGSGAQWGSLSDQDQVTHQDVLGTVTVGPPRVYHWGEFDQLKLTNYADAREPVFHYAISAHGFDGDASGIARGIGSSDLLVTLGEGCELTNGSECTFGVQEQAGTLMHELGHNLGLRHGGGDDLNYKPNYLSVMNYFFQLGWLVRSDNSRVLDYSRFGFSIDETALSEPQGFGMSPGSAPSLFYTGVFCSNGSLQSWLLLGRVDYNCDGAITDPGTVATDTNRDGSTTALAGFVDWPNIVYHGGAIGAPGRSVPADTESIEATFEELREVQQALEAAIAASIAAQSASPAPPADPPGASPAPGDPAGPQQASAALLSDLRIRPRRVPTARRGGSILTRAGARVTYRLDRESSVVFTVQKRKKRRWKAVPGRFVHDGGAGSNALRFTGRMAGKRLKPGLHRLTATPKGGVAVRATFKVRR